MYLFQELGNEQEILICNIYNKVRRTIMNTIVNLSGEWISSFIQNNKIYNEKVNFEQNGDKLVTNIILNYDNEICKYKFNGKINKNIINGTYEILENSDIESGTIILKIINENFYMV